MPEDVDVTNRSIEEKKEASVDVQLGGRHLTLAVAGLALFGLVLFLLGRWSERVGKSEPPPVEEVESVRSPSHPPAPDPASAPKDLTFYDTLGKQSTPMLQEPPKSEVSRQEPPAELPPPATSDITPPEPEPPAPPKVAATQEPAKVAQNIAKESAAAPPPKETGVRERYRIQVASTRDLTSARQLVAKLRKKGYEAAIETATGSEGRSQYKVRIGNYSERASAEKVAEKIRQEERVGAWIVKVQG